MYVVKEPSGHRMAEEPEESARTPLERALELLAGKWTSALLSTLASGAMRYGELRTRLGRLSDKVLTQRLRDLERKGLIRRAYADSERRCQVYQLTDRAESLQPIMKALHDWGERNSVERPLAIETWTDQLTRVERVIECGARRKQ